MTTLDGLLTWRESSTTAEAIDAALGAAREGSATRASSSPGPIASSSPVLAPPTTWPRPSPLRLGRHCADR